MNSIQTYSATTSTLLYNNHERSQQQSTNQLLPLSRNEYCPGYSSEVLGKKRLAEDKIKKNKHKRMLFDMSRVLNDKNQGEYYSLEDRDSVEVLHDTERLIMNKLDYDNKQKQDEQNDSENSLEMSLYSAGHENIEENYKNTQKSKDKFVIEDQFTNNSYKESKKPTNTTLIKPINRPSLKFGCRITCLKIIKQDIVIAFEDGGLSIFNISTDGKNSLE